MAKGLPAGARSKVVKAVTSVIKVADDDVAKRVDDFVTQPGRVVRDPTYARPKGYREGTRSQAWNNAVGPPPVACETPRRVSS